MDKYHEIIGRQEGLPITAFIQSADIVNMHWHNEIEITLVLQGSVDIRVGNKTYLLKEDDLVVINNNAIHNTTKTKEDNILLVLKVDPEYYSKYYSGLNNIEFDCKSFDREEEDQERFHILRHHLAKLVWEFNKKKEAFKLMVGSEMHLLLAHLVNNFKVISDEKKRISSTDKDMERMQRIMFYIDENIDKGVSLQGIADREHLNTYYLSHFIKRMLGISFQEYLNYIRLDKSLKLLSTTNKTITEISYESGFPSTKSLNRIFRREFDCSPSEYRKDNKKISSSSESENERMDRIKSNAALVKLFSYLKTSDSAMEDSL